MKPRTSMVSPRNLEHQATAQLVDSPNIQPCRQSAKPGKPTIGVVGSDVRRRPQLRAVFADLYCYFQNTGAEDRAASPEKKVLA